jgi:predicted nucleotidyltransferase
MGNLQEQLSALFERYDLVAAYAFGSRADEIAACVRGEAVEAAPLASDADIGVLPARQHPLTPRDRVRLTIALEDLLHASRVDLVVLSEADPFLAANVVRGARLFARDEYEADEYDLYVLRRAGDLAPLERERMRLILGDEA